MVQRCVDVDPPSAALDNTDTTLRHRHVFIKVCSEALLCWTTIPLIQRNQIQESRENYYYYSTTKEK